MIIDSPIVSGSYAGTGSLNQVGNVAISGSLTVTGSIIGDLTGTASFAVSTSYAANTTTSSFAANATSASYAAVATSASYSATASSADQFNVRTSLTASGLHYPTTDGAFQDQILQTDATGNLSFGDVSTTFDTVYNGEATTLVKGTPVYVSGSNGANPKVYRADASDANKMPVIYIVSENITSGNTGRGITLGHIEGIDLTGYNEGTAVYVAAGGGWTSTRPTGSNTTIQFLGLITKGGSGGKGLVLNPGPATLPNIQTGYAWVGDSNSYPTAISTSSLLVNTASYSNTSTSASYAASASNATYAATASSADAFTVRNTLTAQTLVVQTITSSVVYASGSNIFGNNITNTQILTGSVSVTGSLAVNGSNVILTNQTSSMSVLSASYASTASFVTLAQTASFVTTAQTASFVQNAQTASYVENAQTASFVQNAQSASYALTSSYAVSSSHTKTIDGGGDSYLPMWSGSSSLTSSIVYQPYNRSISIDAQNKGGGVYLSMKENQSSYASFRMEVSGGAVREEEMGSWYSSYNSYFSGDGSAGEWRFFAYPDSTEAYPQYRGTVEMWIPATTANTGSFTIAPYYNTSLAIAKFWPNGMTTFNSATKINSVNTVQVNGSIYATSLTGSLLGTASYATNALTASYASNVPATASFAISASQAFSSSYALTASYISGSGGGVGFPFSGSAVITGSLLVTNLGGSDVRYLVTDNAGNITSQAATASIKQIQTFTASAGQTTFTITNGYTTGLIDVFINGTKLNPSEFTDTSGTNIVLLTGSFANDIVEFNKYLPAAGVTNNALRQITYFTASAGQTVFSASYVPGLIDIFYNGSKLDNSDYTANNGTFFTLATASLAGDKLEVDVYSYQVGAFSGIGGAASATQVAYFDSTNSITGSPNFTISGSTMTVTGSLTVSGSGTFTNIGPAVFSGSLTSTQGFTGSFSGTATNATSASYASSATSASYALSATSASYALNTTSASYALTASSADAFTVRNTLTAQTLVVQTVTSSIVYSSGSNIFGNALANTQTFTGSVLITGSLTSNGTLSGTSATFSSTITSTTGTTGAAIKLGGFTNYGTIQDVNDVRRIWFENVGSYRTIFDLPSAGTSFVFRDNAGTILTTISSSGAAIFASTVDGTIFNSTSNAFRFSGNNAISLVSLNAQNVVKINAAGYWGAQIVGANDKGILIDNTGQVGIGTTSPSGVFHAQATNSGIFFDLSTAYTPKIKAAGAISDIQIESVGSGGNVYLSAPGATSLIAMSVSGSEKLRITSAGNIGIGITNPARKLDIVAASEQLRLAYDTAGTTYTDFRCDSAGGLLINTSANYIINYIGGSEKLRITGATTNSQVTFTNSTSYSTSNTFALTYRSSTISYGVQPIADIVFDTVGDAASQIRFVTRKDAPDYATRMTISSTGDVYIGGSTSLASGALIVGDNSSTRPVVVRTSGGVDATYSLSMAFYPWNTAESNAILNTVSSAAGQSGFRFDVSNGGGTTGRTASMYINRASVSIVGSLSKGSGTFKIDHPLESKKDTHHLVHSFVEGPRADLIYRGKVTLVNGTATINIDESAGMTEGTFAALNRDVQCFTTNESGWDLVKGEIEENILTITSQNPNSTDKISWMVIGERQDKHIKNTDWTDENGKPILEPLK